MSEIKYSIDTKWGTDEVIRQKMLSTMDDHIETLSKWSFNAKEAGIKNALKEMGWLDPEEATSLEAENKRLREAMRESENFRVDAYALTMGWQPCGAEWAMEEIRRELTAQKVIIKQALQGEKGGE